MGVKLPSFGQVVSVIFLTLIMVQIIVWSLQSFGLLKNVKPLGIPIILFVFGIVVITIFKLVLYKGGQLERKDVLIILLLVGVAILSYFFLDKLALLKLQDTNSVLTQSIISIFQS